MDDFKLLGWKTNKLKTNKVTLDNSVFRLHYKLTLLMLAGFAIVISMMVLGSPIQCSVDKAFDDSFKDVMNTFCWIQSTFTIPHLLSDENIAYSKAHPGVRPQAGPEDKVQYHKYYQWVAFALIFQALLFYIPHYIWRIIEGGRVKMLVMDLNQKNLEKNSTFHWEKKVMVDYFVTSMSENQGYLYGFVICEFLNFANVVGQIFFTDMFLGYEFTKYGTQVLDFINIDNGSRIDPMDRIFPKVTKCTFNKYGGSGNIINFDGICVLPMNIINEKIYVFLWFWFIVLAAISGVALIYRLATILSPRMRLLLLRKQIPLLTEMDDGDEESRKKRQKDIEQQEENIQNISATCQTGDWFLLYQLGKNINSVLFREIIADMGTRKKFVGPASSLRE